MSTADFVRSAGQGLQIVLCMTFAISASSKLVDLKGFVRTVENYRLLGGSLTVPAAAGVVVLEGLVALSLLTDRWRSAGLAISGLLLVGFTVAVGVNLRRGRRIPCGCFGSSGVPISAATLWRLGFLLAATLIVSGLARSQGEPLLGPVSLVSKGSTDPTLIVSLLFASSCTMVAVWLLDFPRLVSLFGSREARR